MSTGITKKLEKRRETLGWSYQRVRDRVYDILGAKHTPSTEKIRRIHTDANLEVDPVLLAAICQALGLNLVDVSPEAAEYLLKIARRVPGWVGVIDLTECAPWELNPQPAERDALPGQLVFAMASAA